MLKIGETLDDEVYNNVKEMIINHKLKAGDLIVQNQLSKDLGVSRTPLRKALGELEKEGLLKKTPKGWYVREFTIGDMISVFEIRAVLEGLACRLAAQKIDQAEIAYLRTLFTSAYQSLDENQAEGYYQADIKFHSKILEIANDWQLKKTVQTNQIISTSLMQGLYRQPKETYKEHMAIIDALEQGNGDLAEDLMCQHLRAAVSVLKSGKYEIYK